MSSNKTKKDVLLASRKAVETVFINKLFSFGTLYLTAILIIYFIFSTPVRIEFVFIWILITAFNFIHVDYRNNIKIRDLTKINKQLNYIEQLTTALRSSTKTEDVLKLVMKNLTEELGYDRVIIYSLETDEKKKELLKPITAYGIDYNMIKEHIFKLDKALDIIPRVAVERKGYIILNAKDDYRCSQGFVAMLGLQEFTVVPLVTKNTLVGVLFADNIINKRHLEELDLVPLMSFANQVAMTLENAKLYEKVEYLAIRDGLTNVYNHRCFIESLNSEIQRMTRYEKDGIISIIMLDIDNFKHYNDTNGHKAGDSVLVEVGQILKDLTRKVDKVARYGGEEFIIMLPSTQKNGAMMLAERIRQTIENHPFEFAAGQPGGKLTVSLGVSTYPEDGTSEENLVNIADKGLYISKASGRNRVSIARAK
ncbi:MAG: sensor domain-containing diguanylate cyclase [Candidatus Firestonebacteria bacterium]|nr:sensor domain-containing diguanylate cyclase [Candidatus Firestonebacteria bacterium]